MAKSSLVAGVALASALAALAGSAAASETRCMRGDNAIRRVEIAAQDPNQNVPCEVIYWKDTEQPGVRNVLWTAQTDAAFCQRKAKELVETLESGGWSCTAAEQPRQADMGAPASAPDASPPERGGGSGVAAASPPAPAPSQPEAKPAPTQPEAAPTPPQQAGSASAPAVREALAPQRAEVEPGHEAQPGAAVGGDTPANGELEAIIEQNLARLNDGVEGKFAAEIADYGDLDGDGRKDGLVFFTYESNRLGQARFVAAYLFDGESYVLAATKPLASSDDHVHSAEVESIDDGVISLRLNILEPGDAACCPSGVRRETLVLRGGQLVEAHSAAETQGRS